MSRRAQFTIGLAAAALIVLAVVLGGAAGGRSVSADKAKLPAPRPMPPPSDFVGKIDNKYFSLIPGTTRIYRGTDDGEPARIRVEVTRRKKTILGVRATVVLDSVFIDGRPEEKTFDWYAQDKRGNVWYLGEDSFDYKNGKWVRNDGSWEAGVDGAKPGIIMEAKPKVGDTYRQEYYKGHAEDVARVLSTNASVSVPFRSFTHALKTRDWTPLEPGIVEHKFYAEGIEVRAVKVSGGRGDMKLVGIGGVG